VSTLFLVSSAQAVYGATYYVSRSGSNGNTCAQAQSISTPKQSLNNAVGCLSAGDTLLVRGGTYAESLLNPPMGSLNIPSGSSWSSATRIAAFPGETVWLHPSSGVFVIYLSGTTSYVEFDGINVDGDDVSSNPIKLESYDGSHDPHHIRFANAEIVGESDTVITPETRVNILVVGIISNAQGGNEFINLKIHRARSYYIAGGSLGLYVQTSNNLVDGCEFYDFRFAGMQIYNGYGNKANNNVIRNSRFHDPTRIAGQPHIGYLIYSTNSNTRFYNNIVYNIQSDGANTKGVEFGDASNVQLYNNTFYNIAGTGISVQGSSNVIKNNIAYQNATNYADNGGGTIGSNNMIDGTNPSCANPGGGDFRLQSNSRAIDAGAFLTFVTTYIEGPSRPQGQALDLGAYEFNTSSSPTQPAPPTNVRIMTN
jgi:hypothetical protein